MSPSVHLAQRGSLGLRLLSGCSEPFCASVWGRLHLACLTGPGSCPGKGAGTPAHSSILSDGRGSPEWEPHPHSDHQVTALQGEPLQEPLQETQRGSQHNDSLPFRALWPLLTWHRHPGAVGSLWKAAGAKMPARGLSLNPQTFQGARASPGERSQHHNSLMPALSSC